MIDTYCVLFQITSKFIDMLLPNLSQAPAASSQLLISTRVTLNLGPAGFLLPYFVLRLPFTEL